MQINTFLVNTLKISNKQATLLIADKKVLIDNEIALQKQVINHFSNIVCNAIELQKASIKFCFSYYKPVGVESTMNAAIPNNLSEVLPINEHFFPVGRLDKLSEGLMLLTNDGELYNRLTDPKKNVEKEYEVEVNQPIDTLFILRMESGIEIMGKKTAPCKVFNIDMNTFNIILTEGKNRQIRRMCYKLGYEVVNLKRIRIANVHLGQLMPGNYSKLSIEYLY